MLGTLSPLRRPKLPAVHNSTDTHFPCSTSTQGELDNTSSIQGYVVLALWFSFISNSCWPNAALRWDEDAHELVLTALEDIDLGACVCVGWVPTRSSGRCGGCFG